MSNYETNEYLEWWNNGENLKRYKIWLKTAEEKAPQLLKDLQIKCEELGHDFGDTVLKKNVKFRGREIPREWDGEQVGFGTNYEPEYETIRRDMEYLTCKCCGVVLSREPIKPATEWRNNK